MKKLMLTGLLVLLGAFSVYAQNLPSVKVVNNTGHYIYHVFVSPAENDSWGNDILGADDILENGQTVTFELTQPLNVMSVYDIRLVDEERNCYVKWSITMTNNIRIVFTIDDLDDD